MQSSALKCVDVAVSSLEVVMVCSLVLEDLLVRSTLTYVHCASAVSSFST